MSNFYGGNQWETIGKSTAKVVLFIGLLILFIELLWNLINHQFDFNSWKWAVKFWTAEGFSERRLSNVGTLYDAAGLAARQNQVASNAGYEGMVSKNQHKSHLVGGYDRPTTWVPGLYTNMPNGWMNSTDPTPEVSQGDVRAGKTTVSGMSNSLGGDMTLENALNSM